MSSSKKNLQIIFNILKKFKIDNKKLKKINMLDIGLIDSFSYFSLINELELKFNIKFSDRELYSKNNKKLDFLIKLTQKKIKQQNV